MDRENRESGIVRKLAETYAEIAAKPEQQRRRELWSDHFSLKDTPPPVLVLCGMHDAWVRDDFARERMACEDPFWRRYERWLRLQIFHESIGDDYICEPWIPQAAVRSTRFGLMGEPWGVSASLAVTDMAGGAYKPTAPIQTWDDMDRLTVPRHEIDEDATQRNFARLINVVGDIIDVDVNRGPVLTNFAGDISTTITALRGLEQIMLDMYDSPEEYKRLLARLRDGILENQAAAEEAGHFSLTSHFNQQMSYANELEPPAANSGPRKRKELWGFFAAQEYTLISPEFHDEFLLQYQIPIMAQFGLTHYGCCEDLSRKIDYLRQVPNLRSIAVAPAANIETAAAQIGRDYAISWRPNPTDMVCAGWDPERVSSTVRHANDVFSDCHYHIHLKDTHTVQNEPDRLQRWTDQVREALAAA